jgi:hypothetical protein
VPDGNGLVFDGNEKTIPAPPETKSKLGHVDRLDFVERCEIQFYAAVRHLWRPGQGLSLMTRARPQVAAALAEPKKRNSPFLLIQDI